MNEVERTWEHEPDEWHGEFDGFEVAILRNPELKNLCGYLKLPTGHPWFGAGRDIDANVHGGITFTGRNSRLSDGYWVGFDCAHAFDLVPSIADVVDLLDVRYRNINYVKEELRDLAKQARGSVASQ